MALSVAYSASLLSAALHCALDGAGCHHLAHHLQHQRRVTRDHVDVSCGSARGRARAAAPSGSVRCIDGALAVRRAPAEAEAVLAIDDVQLADAALVGRLGLAVDALAVASALEERRCRAYAAC